MGLRWLAGWLAGWERCLARMAAATAWQRPAARPRRARACIIIIIIIIIIIKRLTPKHLTLLSALLRSALL